MRNLLGLVASCLVLFGCVDDAPTGPREPSEPRPSISDGAHGGNPYFYWLPPLTKNPRGGGEFNPDLSPTVEICEWSGTGNWSETGCVVRARFERNGSEPARAPRLRVAGNHYHVNWDTDLFAVDLDKLYRLRVLIGTRELGHLDVVFGANGRDANRRATAETVGVVLGRTMPLRFRIFDGALCWPDPACEEALASGELLETTLTPDGGTFIVPSGHAGVAFQEGAISEDVTLLIYRRDVENAQDCLPTPLPQFEGCYNFSTIPRVDQFATPAVLGFCHEAAADPFHDHLQIHQFDPDNPDAGVTALENVAIPFTLTCDDFVAMVAPPGGFAQFALESVIRPLAELFAVSRAHAGDLGLGGLVTSFSHFAWVVSASIEVVEGDDQIAALGATLPVPPKVRLVTTHPDDQTTLGVEEVDLIFTYRDPDAALAGPPVTVTTDADGYASAPWTLGALTGTYTLEVSLAPIDGVEHGDIDPAVFTATAEAAPPAGSTVSGTIFYSTNGLSGALIEIDVNPTGPPGGSHPYVVTTDASGDFSVSDVPDGSYWMGISGPTSEYGTLSQPFTVEGGDVSFDIDLPKLLTPTPPTGATVTSVTPTLQWSENPEAATYRYAGTSQGSTVIESAYDLTSTSHTVQTPLTPGETYTWGALAFDAEGNWVGTTGGVTFTVSATAGGSTLSGSVNYSADGVGDAPVEVSQIIEGVVTTLYTATTDESGNFSIPGVADGSYTVTACCPADGDFVTSSGENITVAGDDLTVTLFLQKSIEQTSPEDDSIIFDTTPELTWDAPPEATNFRVTIYSADLSTVIEQQAGIVTSQYTVETALTIGQSYVWTVEGWDTDGNFVAHTFGGPQLGASFTVGAF